MENQEYLKQRLIEEKAIRKSPGMSAFLALLFPVLGALYTRRWIMAVIFLVLDLVFVGLIFIGIGFVLLLLYRVVAAIICYNGARKVNVASLEAALSQSEN